MYLVIEVFVSTLRVPAISTIARRSALVGALLAALPLTSIRALMCFLVPRIA